MATINLATKFSPKVDEAFTLGSLTDVAVNHDYDFAGVNAVTIYAIETVPLEDYKMNGLNRYGDPSELGDTVETFPLTQDKSFTFAIDRRNADSSEGAKDVGKAIKRQTAEQVIPAVDKYRFGVWIKKGEKSEQVPITNKNAYDQFLDANTALTENMVPAEGRIAYVTTAFYKNIKKDEAFIKASDIGQNLLVRGAVGMVDGVNIIVAPSFYFGDDAVDFIITHKVATTAPVKLQKCSVNTEPQGIDGQLVEGRILHDAFIPKNKRAAVYVHINKALAGA